MVIEKIKDRLKRSPTCTVTGTDHDIDKTVDDKGETLNTICRQCGIRNPARS